MAGSNINQNTFLHGELSPSVQGATESELYNHGLAKCFNSYIQQTGGIYRREGSKVSYIFNTLDEEATYPRYLYPARTTNNHPCVLALSPFGLEIFTRQGRRTTKDFEDLSIDVLNAGVSIIPYKDFFWLFLKTGMYKIGIDDDYSISLTDVSSNIIIPQAPFNTDDKKWVTLTRIDNIQFKLTFSSNLFLDKSLYGQYITIQITEIRFVKDEKDEVTNRSITLHHIVCFSILNIDIENGCTVVTGHFVKENSTVSSDANNVLHIGEKLVKYSVPAFDRKNIPTCVCMYRGRLYLAERNTNIIYASRLVFNEQIDFSRVGSDETGLIATLTSCKGIYWLTATDMALCVGTSSGVYIMDDPAPQLSTISFKLFSNVHVSAIAPIVVNSSVFFVDHGGTRVFEIAKDEISGSYKTYDVGLLSQHLLEKGVTSIAYSAYPASLLFCTLANGDFLLMGYNRSNDIYAWTRHRLGGFDTHVDNVACVNFFGKDYFFLSVSRRQNGELIRSIEYIENNYASETDSKYSSCYVDSAHVRELKTNIKNINFGRPFVITFDTSLSEIPSSRLLITTSTDDPRSALWISDFAVSFLQAVCKSFQHMPKLEEFKFENENNKKLSAFQRLNNDRAPISYKCQLISNADDNLCLRLIGGAQNYSAVSSSTVFLFTDALDLVDSVFNDIKKFVAPIDEEGGVIWKDDGWTIVLLDKATKLPVEKRLEEAIDVTDKVWVKVGDGIVTGGRPAYIEVDGIYKPSRIICKDISHLRKPIVNEEVINVLEQAGICTRGHVFMNLYTLGVIPDKIDSFGGFCPYCPVDAPAVWCITAGHLLGLLRCNDIKGEHIITTSFVDDHGLMSEVNNIVTNEGLLLIDVLSNNGYTVCVFDTKVVCQTLNGKRNILPLDEGEKVLGLDDMLLITNRKILDVDKLDAFPHPFDTAVKCADIVHHGNVSTLFVGGVRGLLWRHKQEDGWVQVLHNRHMTIHKICVLNDDLLAYSRYGDGLLFSSAVTAVKVQNNTITTNREDMSYPMSVVQFCPSALPDDGISCFLIEHFSVLIKIKFSVVNENTVFVPTKTDKILVHGITSFDFLNDRTWEVLDVALSDLRPSKIYISVPLGANYHVFDEAQDINGEVYFKSYSCANLSRYYEQELRVTADGIDRGDEYVRSDSVYIPRGGYSISVGYPYEQQIFTLDLSGGAVKGSSVGAIARQITLCLRVLNSSAGEYSTDGLKWYPIAFTKYTRTLHGQQVYTGVIKMTLPNGIRNVTTRMLYIRNRKAEPLNIMSITRETYVSDN